MTTISRRSVLAGLGGAILSAAVPSHSTAIPSIEEVMGPERMEWLSGLFRARYLPLIDDVLEEALFDRPGHFAASSTFRAGLERLLHDGTPFEMLVDFFGHNVVLPSGRTVDQNCSDRAIAFVLRKANVISHVTSFAFANSSPDQWSPVWWRWWQGDGWRSAGWEAPSPEHPMRKSEFECHSSPS